MNEDSTGAEVSRLVGAVREVSSLAGLLAGVELLFTRAGTLASAPETEQDHHDFCTFRNVLGPVLASARDHFPLHRVAVPDMSYQDGPEGEPTPSDELARLAPLVAALKHREAVEGLAALLDHRREELSGRGRFPMRGRVLLNVGHGHVFPRPDGALVRCGGPAMCSKCAEDLAEKERLAARARSSVRVETLLEREYAANLDADFPEKAGAAAVPLVSMPVFQPVEDEHGRGVIIATPAGRWRLANVGNTLMAYVPGPEKNQWVSSFDCRKSFQWEAYRDGWEAAWPGDYTGPRGPEFVYGGRWA